jgi:hypothetical protein
MAVTIGFCIKNKKKIVSVSHRSVIICIQHAVIYLYIQCITNYSSSFRHSTRDTFVASVRTINTSFQFITWFAVLKFSAHIHKRKECLNQILIASTNNF